MNKSYIGVVILNYNNYQLTINCVESILQYNSYPIKILIVDNGSEKSDIESLRKELFLLFGDDFSNIELNMPHTNPLSLISLLELPINLGYASGNNKGLSILYDIDCIEYVLILNNDILFVDDILSNLMEKYAQIDNVGVLSPVLYTKDMASIDYNCARIEFSVNEILLPFLFLYRNFLGIIDRINNRKQLLRKDKSLLLKDKFEIDLPSGSCMLIRKDVVQIIGGFDENTFLYYEENILHKKLSRENLKSYIIPNARCIHLGASSTVRTPHGFAAQCGLESAEYFLKNYCTLSLGARLLMFFAKHIFKLKLYLIKKIDG
jgi:GT2 family glycosyltransferase